MKQMLSMSLLALSLLPAAWAAGETPDQCFGQAKLMPADQQEEFLRACLGHRFARPARQGLRLDC